MIKKVLVSSVIVLAIFLGYVSTRNGKFRYERSGVINASADRIFPYISDLNRGAQWSPYEKKDPHLKRTFIGPGNQVGSIMEFDGSKDVGSGKIEILKILPNERVDLKLTMLKPFHAENLIEYNLRPEGAGTRFTWTISGDGGFMGKLMGVLIDCEKMVTGDFEVGIANLKHQVEGE